MPSKPFCQVFALLFSLCLFVLLADPVSAHRVNVFAWVENGQVHVKASFGRKNPARQADVIVMDGKDHAELLRGQTDDSGQFVFAMLESGPASGLLIRVNAGEGHQNDWQLKADECAAGVVAENQGTENVISQTAGTGKMSEIAPGSGSDHSGNGPANDSMTASTASLAEIRAIVDASLESKLGPIRAAIAQQSEQGPRLQDIVGGLGWIMGIVGIGLAVRARKG